MGVVRSLRLRVVARAAANDTYMHDGTTCESCHVPGTGGAVTNAQCQACHTSRFQTSEGRACWSCHRPGQDMSGYQTSVGCTLDCHVYDTATGKYDTDFTHGTTPHLGADFAPCLDCHQASLNFLNPGQSPHHDTVVLQPPTCTDCHNGVYASLAQNHDDVAPVCEACHVGMDIPVQPAVCNRCHAARTYGPGTCTDCHSTAGIFGRETVHTTDPSAGTCSDCHAGYRQHAGPVVCGRCHTKAATFHHDVTAGAGKKGCGACHDRRHDGRAIGNATCARCHTGNAPAAKPRAQHSQRIARKRKCGLCHGQRLHAAAAGTSLTCRSCHKVKFHGRQTLPTSGVCYGCHARARAHAAGYSCLSCHAGSVHRVRPQAGGH